MSKDGWDTASLISMENSHFSMYLPKIRPPKNVPKADPCFTFPQEDGWNSVTCFCRKPFAGRPMIECSACLTWVHLKCANMHRKKIPDEWYCPSCRGLAPPGSGPIQESPSSSSTSSNNKTPKQAASKTKTTPKSAPSPTKPVSGEFKPKLQIEELGGV